MQVHGERVVKSTHQLVRLIQRKGQRVSIEMLIMTVGSLSQLRDQSVVEGIIDHMSSEVRGGTVAPNDAMKEVFNTANADLALSRIL